MAALNPLLRSYQRQAIERALEAILDKKRRGLIVLPTGCGKTFVFAELARLLGLPTLVMVHRDELIHQTIRTVCELWPTATTGIIKADRHEDYGDVVVASIQSLGLKRLERIPKDRFGVLIIDECHHVPAPTFDRAFAYFDAGYKLGVTATPERLDGKGLAKWFGNEPVYVYPLIQAIREKHLVDIVQYQIETETDLDTVSTRMGDFAEGELAEAVNTHARNRAIVQAFRKRGGSRRAIVFAVNLSHAHNLALEFSEAGFASACVSGRMALEERRDWLHRFAAGRVQVLVNCEILTEGFDDPDCSCIIMARPTESRAFYTQCIGRGLRRPKHNHEKRDCLILDITDNCKRHKLITVTSLLGAKRKSAEGISITEVLAQEEREEKERQERVWEESCNGIVKWRLKSVCPWPELPSLDGYRATRNWHNDDASEKQLQALAGFGLKIARYPTKGEAAYLLDQAIAYEQTFPAPATSKQEFFLRMHGTWVEGMTKKQAGTQIGKIKKVVSHGENGEL